VLVPQPGIRPTPYTSARSIALYSVLEREKIRLSIGDRGRFIVPTDVHSLYSPEVEVDRTDPELMHHVGRIKENGNRALRVVFNNSASPVRIVTVYFGRKLKDRL
jgi:hypothetical protein